MQYRNIKEITATKTVKNSERENFEGANVERRKLDVIFFIHVAFMIILMHSYVIYNAYMCV